MSGRREKSRATGRSVSSYEPKGLNQAIDIFLDQYGQFMAEVADEVFVAPSLSALKSKLANTVKTAVAALSWSPVIKCAITGPGYFYGDEEGNHEAVKLELDRFYIAKQDDRRWVQAEWDVPEGERGKRATSLNSIHVNASGRLPWVKATSAKDKDEPVTLSLVEAHTDERWDQLLALKDSLLHLRAHLVAAVAGKPEQLGEAIADLRAVLNLEAVR